MNSLHRQILIGDVLEKIKEISNDSIDCVITSPPYFNLRDYGVEGQWGSESTFSEYLDKMMKLMDEIKRVLKPSGTAWINLGDCYGSHRSNEDQLSTIAKVGGKQEQEIIKDYEKSRLGIPERFYIRCIDSGWIARNHIVWYKENAMPSSIKDRMTNKWESIFFFAKERRYYFNLAEIREKPKSNFNTKPFNLRVREAKKGKGQMKLGEDPRAWKCSEKEKEDYNDKGERKEVQVPYPEGIEQQGVHKKRDEGLPEPNRKTNNRIVEMAKTDGNYKGLVGSSHGIKADGTPLVNPFGKNPGDVWLLNSRPFSEAHFACVSEDTEVWTTGGWKNIDTLTTNDEILTLNISDNTLHYHKPYDIYKYNYNGDLILIENRYVSQLVTPNHRVLLKFVHSAKKRIIEKEWHYVQAQDITPHSGIRLPISGNYNTKSVLELSDAFVEILGWVITEGYFTKYGNKIEIYQSKNSNPLKVERIEKCLKQCNIPFQYQQRERPYDYKTKQETISICSIFIIPTEYSLQIKNIIPHKKLTIQLITYLSNHQLEILYESLIAGDGHRRKDNRDCWIQKDVQQLDLFRLLCLKLGKRTFLGSRGDCVYVTNRNDCQIHQSDFNDNYKKVKFTGRVWCPNLPNTNFIAKRNNRIFITGNTFPVDLPIKILKCACPKKVCVKCGQPQYPIYDKNVEHNRVNDRPDANVRPDSLERPPSTWNYLELKIIGWTKCNCNEKFKAGLCLDPFFGAGTVAVAAEMLSLDWCGIELKESYTEIARKRLNPFTFKRLDEFL